MGEAEKQVREEKPEKSLEEAFQELDALADKLEEKGISLDESFRIYKQGMDLLKFCGQQIDTVEKKMLQIDKDGGFSEF